MNKFFPIYLLTICLSFLIFSQAQAALVTPEKMTDYRTKINNTASEANYSGPTKLEDVISRVIKIVLSVLGVIFLALMFAAGNTWMMAAGNEEKIKESQKKIQNLLIGLCIILVAYALSSGFSGLLTKVLLTK